MKPSEQEIEQLLRHAPRPAPPAGLKQQLSDQMRLPAAETTPRVAVTHQLSGGWWRRWWPALAPTAVSLACAAVLTVQRAEIRDLKETIRSLSNSVAVESSSTITTVQSESATAGPVDLAAKEQEEIARLKERVKQLTTDINQLEQTQRENEALRRQIAAPPTLTQEELDAIAEAKERAQSISCINNLKQVGLAVRLYAMDSADVNPPDFLSMSNELNTPKILVCPGQTNNTAAASWATYTSANCSYEYLTPLAPNADSEPTRVQTRCPIHGHIGLCDGSVQSKVAKTHPDWLVERDGKLYMESKPQRTQ